MPLCLAQLLLPAKTPMLESLNTRRSQVELQSSGGESVVLLCFELSKYVHGQFASNTTAAEPRYLISL